MKKGFTLIELVVAIALLVVLLTFASLIFKVGVGSYRMAQANAEIMRNLRAITDQLDIDFAGFQKDGYLIIQSEIIPDVKEFENTPDADKRDFRSDRIYYFSVGDYQSWFMDSSNNYPRSNIAQVCWGHDGKVYWGSPPYPPVPPVSQWQLMRELNLLMQQSPIPGSSTLLPPLPGLQDLLDCNDISYSALKSNGTVVSNVYQQLLTMPGIIDTSKNANQKDSGNIRKLLCQNVGELKIEWTDGTTYDYIDPTDGLTKRQLAWFGLDMWRSIGDASKDIDSKTGYAEIPIKPGVPSYQIRWGINTNISLLPRAIKFTFTLYDSKGVIKNGRVFTHIVYIDRLEGK